MTDPNPNPNPITLLSSDPKTGSALEGQSEGSAPRQHPKNTNLVPNNNTKHNPNPNTKSNPKRIKSNTQLKQEYFYTYILMNLLYEDMNNQHDVDTYTN